MKYRTEKEGEHLRIYALKDIDRFGVKKGDKGGLIEKESNLSQDGDCWVFENARVYGDAWVYGGARVYGNARVSGDACVFGYDNLTSTPITCFGLGFPILCSYKDNFMRVGCKSHSLDEWKELLKDKELYEEEVEEGYTELREAVKFFLSRNYHDSHRL